MKNIFNRISLFLIIYLALFAVSSVFSAHLSYMPQSIRQPNGDKIEVFASGDEFYNFLHDANGYTILKNHKDGYYYYAVKSGDSLIPGKQRVINGAEPAGISKWLRVGERHYMPRVRAFRQLFDSEAKSGETLQERKFININNIVICIKFADDTTSENRNYAAFEEMYNSNEKMSLWKYYQIVTNEKMNVKSHIFPQKSENGTYSFFECKHPRNYFEPKSESNPIGYSTSLQGYRRMDTLYYNAINAISPSIDQNMNIDENGDGNVDNVTFIFAGKASGWGTLFWPHMNVLVGIKAYIHDIRVRNYNVLIGDYLSEKGVATICHEFLHSLGAPDYYDYTYTTEPVGQWELMAHTTNEPNQCGAFVRYKYLKTIEFIPEITKSGRYTLNSIDKKSNTCYKVQSYNRNEYYVLEFRNKKHVLDKSMPLSGLLVYRVNESYFGSSDSIQQQLYIYRPNGKPRQIGKVEWAPFSANEKRTELNENTNPMPFLEDGIYGGLNISNISEIGETMSFDILLENPKPFLIYPSENCGLVHPKLSVRWRSYKPKYLSQVIIAKDLNFNEIVYNEKVVDDHKLEVELEENREYYIRVRDVFGDYKSEWSETVKFRTLSFKHQALLQENFDEHLTLPLDWYALEGDEDALWQVNTLVYDNKIYKTENCLWGKVLVEPSKINYITLAKIDTNLAEKKVLYLSILKDINTHHLRLKVFQSDKPNLDANAKLIAQLNANKDEEPRSREQDFERVSIQLDENENLPYIILAIEGDVSNVNINNYIYLDDIEIHAVRKKDCYIYLTSPAQNEKDIEPNAELSWSDDCSELYEVQIAEDMEFKKIIYSQVTSDKHIKPKILNYNRKYYWRVQGLSNVGTQKWGAFGAFTTKIKFAKQALPDSLIKKMVMPSSSITAKIKLNQFGKYFINNRIMNSNDVLLLYSKKDNKEYLMGYVSIQPELGASITVYADNPDTDAKDGFSHGESYIFKVWDSEMKVVRSASHNVFIGRDVFEANSETIIDVVNGLETNELELSLETGWNLISANLVPSINNIYHLNYELNHKAIVLDSLHNIVSDESSNKVKYLDYTQGYYLHWEDKPSKLKIKGDEIPKSDKFLKIYGAGWHLIPYLRKDVVKVEQYFGKSVNTNIVMVKDMYGNIYYPPYINTLKLLQPGRAYLVYTSASISVDYNFLHSASDNNQYKDIKQEIKEYSNALRLKNLSNYAVLVLEIEGAKSGEEIAITLGKNANSFCVGNARTINPITYSIISGYDTLLKNTKYQTINGAKEGEKLYIFSTKKDEINYSQELEIISIYDVLANKELPELRFSENALIKVKARVPNSSVPLKDANQLYPNPANRLVYIDLADSINADYELMILDIHSKIYTLDSTKIQHQIGRLSVDISELPAGTYFFELRSGELSKSYMFFKY